MRRLPPLGALRAFEAAARHESFKRAAEELGVTPTAISHQIRLLEADVGAPLFARRVRRVVLTSEGRLLRPGIQSAFETMIEAVAALRRPVRRQATLSATFAFTARLLVPRVATFRERFPDLDLRLHASDDPADLSAGVADAAIRYGSGHYPGLAAVALFRDRFGPVCDPSIGVRSPGDLARATLIHFEWGAAARKQDAPTWQLWAERAGLATFDTRAGITFSDEASAIRAAIAGQGVALVSYALVAVELETGALVSPFGPSLEGLCYDFVFPHKAESKASVVALRDWVTEQFGPGTQARTG